MLTCLRIGVRLGWEDVSTAATFRCRLRSAALNGARVQRRTIIQLSLFVLLLILHRLLVDVIEVLACSSLVD